MTNDTALSVQLWPSEGPQVMYSDGKAVYFLSHENSLTQGQFTTPVPRRDLLIMQALLQLATEKVEAALAAQGAKP